MAARHRDRWGFRLDDRQGLARLRVVLAFCDGHQHFIRVRIGRPGIVHRRLVGDGRLDAHDRLPRALCDWKNAKSSGLEGSAVIRSLAESIVSLRIATESGSNGCFNAGVTSTSRSLALVSRRIAHIWRMSGSPARVDDRIDENGLLGLGDHSILAGARGFVAVAGSDVGLCRLRFPVRKP